MADITSGIGSQRALALQKARAEAADDAKFGRQFSDRLGGGLAAALYGVGGGLTDLYSNAAGMFGQEDMAARMGMQSDEMYRRALANLEGKEAGLEASSSSQIGLTPGERSTIASRENNQIIASAINAGKFAQNVDAGGPYDAGVPYDVGFDPLLQTGKPNTTAIRKEGESKDDFRNRILNEQSVTSSYDFEGPQSLSPAQIMQQKINDLIDVEASSAGGRGNRQSGEAIGERKQFLDETVPLDGERDMDAASNAFIAALAETNKAKGQKQPEAESRADLLEKYKQEFAEATGIEIDGSPDNSQALMAMGLSLMQNRAGKGFNVGKILNAAGVAGEKAMPYIAKASSEAKAASLAAGKYALGRIQEGESAASAFAAETRKHKNAWDLEVMKQRSIIEQKRIEGGGKAGKLENKEKFKIGAGDITIATGTFKDDEYGERPVFVNGAADAGKITDAYKKYTEGQEYVVNMQDSLTALANRPEGALPAKLMDSIKTFSVKLGLADPKAAFGEDGVSEAEQFQVYQQATINAFKKLILQESQVSNLDLTTLFASFGEVGFMASPEKAKLAIDTMMDYFSAKKRTLQAPISNMTERDWFQTETDYNRTQKLLSGIGINSSSPVATTDGSRYTLDLTAIPKLNETG